LDWNDVFIGPSIATLGSAVAVGLGVTAVTRRLATDIGMIVWEDAPLPKLPDLYSGVYVREGGNRSAHERLASDIAALLHVPPLRAPKLVTAVAHERKANPAA
jgi:hypothetical protein